MYLKDRAGKGKDCWLSVNTIAADLQLSRSTVKRALNDLVKAGLIEKEPRYRENGSHTSNRLILKNE
jgi:predicted transcriptional regulator